MELEQLIVAMKNYNVGIQICQRDKDLGDSLNRLGNYYVSLAALNVSKDDLGLQLQSGLLVRQVTNALFLPEGRFRRGYAPGRWFNNENNVTRDQMVTIQAAWAVLGLKKIARAHFWQRAKRLFTHFSTQNDGADAGPLVHKLPDLPTLPELGTLIRATRYKFLYFLLPVCDMWLYLDVKFGRNLTERAVYDADNQILPQVLAALDQPTFMTEHVRREYAQSNAPERLRAYYSEAPYHDGGNRNGIVPLGEIMVLAFERAVGGISEK